MSTATNRLRLAGIVALTGALATASDVPMADAALPQLRLTTPVSIPDDPKVAGTMTLDGRRYRIGIERRGTSSARFPKKSWGFELRRADGEDRHASLLGLPRHSDWVLYAGWNDASLMRNVLAMKTARRVGHYASRTRFVEVRRNGRYAGVYVLMERLELDRRRVRDGRALLELTSRYQAPGNEPYFVTRATGTHISFNDPDQRDARTRALIEQVDRGIARRRVATTPLDLASAVDYLLVNELFGNPDAFYASTYLRTTRGGRVRLGPVWDFDVAAGNNDWAGFADAHGWKSTIRSPWAQGLLADPVFRRLLAARWQQLRARGIGRHLRHDRRVAQRQLRGAAIRNFRRWPVGDRPGTGTTRAIATHREGIEQLDRWLRARERWMDSELGG